MALYENVVEKILEHDHLTQKIFLGALARDELPHNPPIPCCFIVNTQPRNQAGEHWIAFSFSKNGFCDFFDSYGLSPEYYNLLEYINATATSWTWNKKRLQGSSEFCGYYCVLYLLFKVRRDEAKFFQYFSKSYNQNDKKIQMLLNLS